MSGTALLVDDHQIARRYGRSCLEALGYTVFTAASPAEALDTLTRISPQLLMLDVSMPGGNGFELSREIHKREFAQSAALLFVTRNHSQADVMEARRSGGHYFLMKPYELNDLEAAVKKALRMKRAASRKAPQATPRSIS